MYLLNIQPCELDQIKIMLIKYKICGPYFFLIFWGLKPRLIWLITWAGPDINLELDAQTRLQLV